MSKQKTRTLPARPSSRILLSQGQKILFALIALATTVGFAFNWLLTARVLLMAATMFLVCLNVLKVVVHVASSKYVPPATVPVREDDPDLPRYTLLLALYKESNMLKTLVQALDALQYPRHLLQILFLLEEDDAETQAEVIGMELPDHYQVIVAPDLKPRGKPKALNLGLAATTGAFCVLYDAEDRPDHDQLLKAVAAFRAAPENVACVQARLFFWNMKSSLISRMYWSEYVVHYWFVLTGLAKLGLIPPLGGTSNHFRTEDLHQVAYPYSELPEGAEGVGGWDPWNVTEDAELAGALAMHGKRVMLIDSVTKEEATAHFRIADKQRRRWIKGYAQTGLCYTRSPIRMARAMGPIKWFCYNLLVLGTPVSLVINPIFWGLTITFAITRAAFIQSLFPPYLFYPGVVLFLAGNLLVMIQMMLACLHRDGRGNAKYMLLVPLSWLFTSWSAYRALPELAVPKWRSSWNKTPHGHDLSKEDDYDSQDALASESR